ncbi:cadmium-translocating P-type ATPase, partial [Candidatus Gottesmanbacteria bacterium RIFCSPHIGHO2_02_FULL_39_11]
NLIDKIKGDSLRSGTVNIGEIMVIQVTKTDKDSTYRKIIQMVQEAQIHKAPLIRLADRYSSFFTLITLFLAGSAYLLSHDFSRVLAVLVIATPCPLILATPIALVGGMNAAAKKRIILKKLSSIEVLSRVTTVIFDKTGTITLGRPFIKDIVIKDTSFTEDEVFAISASIERNSLHPLAKAILEEAKKRKVIHHKVLNVKEKIGSGISATVSGNTYSLSKVKEYEGMAIQLLKNNTQIAIFEFEDKIKQESKEILRQLKSLGLKLYIFTGDKKTATQNVLEQLEERVTVRSEMTPQDKKEGIEILKNKHKITAMVGDGINDAPALAYADVGMVFSNEEHTAASEAADIVFLAGDFSAVTSVIAISKRTIHIAYESILFGIGLSTLGMIFAVFGFIPAVAGAFLQEAIDIAVIFNALRASK